MNSQEIHERCVELLRDQLWLVGEAAEVGLRDRLVETCVLDSLDIVELVMAAEEEFEIDLPDGVFGDGSGDLTLGQCEAVVEAAIKRKEAAADGG